MALPAAPFPVAPLPAASFPIARLLPDTTTLRRCGLSLRAAGDSDLAGLRTLFATIRTSVFAHVTWDDASKSLFLDHQFLLQHQYFMTHHAGADFLVVRQRNRAIGRLYVDRTQPTWRIVDIAIAPPHQHRGLGSTLLRWIQRAAARTGADGVDLHVAHDNAGAARLYTALGFVDAITAVPTHRRMTWQAVR